MKTKKERRLSIKIHGDPDSRDYNDELASLIEAEDPDYDAEVTGPHFDTNPNTGEREKYYVVKTNAPRKVVRVIEDQLREEMGMD